MSYTPYPESLFAPDTRHLFIVAHQDDEVMYCGLIQHMPAATRFLWVTNGDGLAPEAKMDPTAYAELRKAETDRVLGVLGRPLEARRCYDHSEIALYNGFVALHREPARAEEVVATLYKPILDELVAEIRAFRPDVVWTEAFQNGHPEHDLTHICTAYALRILEKEGAARPALYQLPQYEYGIMVPHRFHPLYRGVKHRLALTPAEVAVKREAIDCYPSQKELIERFEKVINNLGKLGWLVGKPFRAESYLAHEWFGPVAPDCDYTRSTHWFERANYMGDFTDGQKIRFDTQIAVIASHLLPR